MLFSLSVVHSLVKVNPQMDQYNVRPLAGEKRKVHWSRCFSTADVCIPEGDDAVADQSILLQQLRTLVI